MVCMYIYIMMFRFGAVDTYCTYIWRYIASKAPAVFAEGSESDYYLIIDGL